MKNNLSQVPAYRAFVKERDLALEDFLHKATLEISDVLRGTLSNAVASIDMTYNKIIRNKYHPANISEALGHVEQNLKILFSASGYEIERITDNLRKHSYALAYAGEAEAISRALAKPQDSRLGPDKLKHKSISKMPSGSDPKSRIDMELKSLERKMVDVVHRSAVSELSIEDFHLALAKVIPKRKRIEQKRKSLYKPTMREADQRPKIPVVANEFIDEETWQVLLEEYKNDFVPKWRGPEYVLEQAGPKPTKDDYYAWQFEKELTQDFVEQVRLGQIDAARENGINDFVWIAIVDDVTDDCCLWRDGLTTKEIELELKTKRRDDPCDSSVPPAHFNCATAGHKITTVEGSKLIEDIQVGDLVLTHENRFQKVERTLQSFAPSVLEIELEDGTKIEVTPEHPLFFNGQWVKAESLIVGDKINVVPLDHENDNSCKAREETQAHGFDTRATVANGE